MTDSTVNHVLLGRAWKHVAIALLLIGLPFMTNAATPTSSPISWRPPVVSRYQAMLAQLAPINRDIVAGDAALIAALDRVSVDVTAIDYATLAADAAAVQAAMVEIQRLAVAGLDVLDQFPPEPCFADLWAVSRTAFLLYGDTIEGVRVGISAATVGVRIRLARHLETEYADLIEAVTDCGVPA